MSKHAKRLIPALLLIFVLIFNTISFADTNTTVVVQNVTFKDIPQNHWASEAIQTMSNQGIISGYSDGKFGPKDPITREQLAKLLTLTFGMDLVTPDVQTFSDVPPNRWSYAYVETSKEYLTGYFPPKGKPFFDPLSNATREDVAVALVKAIGLDTESIDGLAVLQRKFHDYDSVSPLLVNEVAAAVQAGLINGYTDGTFRGSESIDRASVATLLYRILKSSYAQASKEILLEVTVPAKAATPQVTITGKVDKSAKLYINDELCDSYDGKINEIFYLQDGEGIYDFEVKAVMSNGRSRVIKKSVEYKVEGPTLTVNMPANITKPAITITGKLTDPSDSYPTLTCNGDNVYTSYNGNWSKEVTLKEGLNKFVFVATNKYDKTTTIEKEIEFNVDAPQIVFNEEIPQSVTEKELKVKFWVKDATDYMPKGYLNNKLLYDWSSDGDYRVYSATVTLNEGENVLTFKAVNNLGKATTITKTVLFSAGAPEILFKEDLPATSSTKTLKIKCWVKDANDSSPRLTLNDKSAYNYNWDGDYKVYTFDYTLTEGENTLVFKSTNSLGKTTTVTKKVIFAVGAPELLFREPIPATVSSKSLTVKVWVKDDNDSSPKMYLNNKTMYNYSWDGDYKVYYYDLTLSEGENALVFKATNSLGKETTATKTVNFTVAGPEIAFKEDIPATVEDKSLRVKCWVKDANDSSPDVYINNKQMYNYSWDGDYRVYYYDLTLSEGSNTLVFKATNDLGKSTTVTKTVEFVVPGPAIEVSIPDTTNKNNIQLSGTIKDATYSYDKLTLTVNGRNIPINYYGSWSYTVELNEGQNTITIIGTNPSGKQTQVQKTVTFAIMPPAITVNVPENVNSLQVEVTGTVKDDMDSKPTLTINDENVTLYSGSFSKVLTLVEGANTITFTATSAVTGKSTTITRTINVTILAPTLNTNVPETSTTETVQVSGNVNDLLDNAVVVKVNDTAVTVNSSGNWNYTLQLVAGENTVKIEAINKHGKSTVITKTIVYTPAV